MTQPAMIALFVGLSLVGRVVVTARGQSPLPRCDRNECEIVLERVVTLSADRYPGLLPDAAVSLIVDQSGRVATHSRARDQLLLFNAEGRLETVLGRHGTHPGELERVTRLVRTADGHSAAYDAIRKVLVTVRPGPTLGAELAMPFEPVYANDNGTMIVAQQIPTADLIGYPIHLVDTRGRVLRSFGAEIPEHRQDLTLLTTRLVAPAADGGVWAVAPGRYVIEKWLPDRGTRVARLAVGSSWFREAAIFRRDERTPPNAIIEGLWESDGLLWVLLRDADEHWVAPPEPNTMRSHDPQEHDRTYDWVVDALDPATGRILASRRFPTALWNRSPSPIVASRAWTSANGGRTTIEVWKTRLQRSSGQREDERSPEKE